MAIGKRWTLIGLGSLLLLAWFACWAMTIAPGGPEDVRWITGNALAFFAGGAFGAALLVRRTGT
jgi:hypothetical protein